MSQFTSRLNRLIFWSYRIKAIERKLDQFIDSRHLRPIIVEGPESTQLWRAYTDLVRPLAPAKTAHFAKKRFGSAHNGGYVMLDHLAGVTAAYSLGIGQEISWDHAMATCGVPVFQFDYSVKNPPFSHPLFHFFPVRIGSSDNAGTSSLESLVQKNSPGEGDLILKIDIEGAEWEVFDTIRPETLKRFRQIVCEFHNFSKTLDKSWLERARRAIDKLMLFHRVIHVHANNVSQPLCADNVFIPDILELSFVRAADYELSDSFEFFPGDFDTPSTPNRPEIPLGTFRY